MIDTRSPGREPRCYLQAGDVRQPGREQALLQQPGQRGTFGVARHGILEGELAGGDLSQALQDCDIAAAPLARQVVGRPEHGCDLALQVTRPGRPAQADHAA